MSSSFIYLASQSPRRRELLAQIGVPHQVISASILEERFAGESALAYVTRLSVEKAQAGLNSVKQQGLVHAPVLGADTIVVMTAADGTECVLEKPQDRLHFVAMMRALSGRTHRVMTSVSLVREGEVITKTVETQVTFCCLDDEQIMAYWDTGEPQDKAGGYGIQGLGSVFISQLQGSYSAVVGLPLAETAELLKSWQIAVWQSV